MVFLLVYHPMTEECIFLPSKLSTSRSSCSCSRYICRRSGMLSHVENMGRDFLCDCIFGTCSIDSAGDTCRRSRSLVDKRSAMEPSLIILFFPPPLYIRRLGKMLFSSLRSLYPCSPMLTSLPDEGPHFRFGPFQSMLAAYQDPRSSYLFVLRKRVPHKWV